jgi:hypothetical protein
LATAPYRETTATTELEAVVENRRPVEWMLVDGKEAA